jgi:hypothetical protein
LFREPKTDIGGLSELWIDEVVDFVDYDDDLGFLRDFLFDDLFP